MTEQQAPDQHNTRKPSLTERRAARWEQRIERYEAKRSGPPPPRHLHRAIVAVLMMAMMLGLLALMLAGPAEPQLAALA